LLCFTIFPEERQTVLWASHATLDYHNAQRQVEVISLSALNETPGENIFDNVSERSITNRKACLQYGIILFSEKVTDTTEKQFPNEVYLK